MNKLYLREFLFPRKCIICNDFIYGDSVFCDTCDKIFTAKLNKFCKNCKRPTYFCDCHSDLTGAPFIHLCEYDDFTKRIILFMKENKNRRVFEYMARKIADIIRKCNPNLDGMILCYIPRSDKNVRIYGFDHAKLLAKYVSKGLNIPLACPFSRKSTVDQKKLDAHDRKENAKTSFSLSKKACNIKGKDVIILDDTSTTGSTLKICADLARQAGAKSIQCVSITKTY